LGEVAATTPSGLAEGAVPTMRTWTKSNPHARYSWEPTAPLRRYAPRPPNHPDFVEAGGQMLAPSVAGADPICL